MNMRVLILSYFNQILGPINFLTAPKSSEIAGIEQIPALMDFYNEGFFIHISGNIKSANLIFEIPNVKVRGYKESLQISIVIDINSKINLNLAKELLKTFAEELSQIEDIYKAFYVTSASDAQDRKKHDELENLFYTFYKSFKPAVKALQEAELRFQSLFKSARDAIIIVDGNSVNSKIGDLLEE